MSDEHALAPGLVPPHPPPGAASAPDQARGARQRLPGRLPKRLPGRLPKRLPVREILCLAPLVLVGVVAVRHWRVLAEGFGQLTRAEWPWLAVAGVTTCLAWVAAAVSRQGAVREQLPAMRLLVTQFASGAANHLLPSGLGATAVNLRFMAVCGVPVARSTAAVALYLLGECVARVGLLALLLLTFPGALRLGVLLPEGIAVGPVLLAVGAGAAVLAVVLLLFRRVRAPLQSFLRTALGEARHVHKRPMRVLALWGGSLAFPVMQASGLVAVGLALGLDVPVMHMALAYLAATVAVAVIPTPGGLGSMEAALVVALVATGAPAALATGVVLGYRIITLWVPLLPGALVLGALVRLKVI